MTLKTLSPITGIACQNDAVVEPVMKAVEFVDKINLDSIVPVGRQQDFTTTSFNLP